MKGKGIKEKGIKRRGNQEKRGSSKGRIKCICVHLISHSQSPIPIKGRMIFEKNKSKKSGSREERTKGT